MKEYASSPRGNEASMGLQASGTMNTKTCDMARQQVAHQINMKFLISELQEEVTSNGREASG